MAFGIEDFRAAPADERTNFTYRYVQPLSRDKQEDPESLRVCLEFVKANSNWSLSRQDHHNWQVAQT